MLFFGESKGANSGRLGRRWALGFGECKFKLYESNEGMRDEDSNWPPLGGNILRSFFFLKEVFIFIFKVFLFSLFLFLCFLFVIFFCVSFLGCLFRFRVVFGTSGISAGGLFCVLFVVFPI